jgi:hypothetical protein
MLATCFSTAAPDTTRALAMAAFERPLGHQREHLAFPRGQGGRPGLTLVIHHRPRAATTDPDD